VSGAGAGAADRGRKRRVHCQCDVRHRSSGLGGAGATIVLDVSKLTFHEILPEGQDQLRLTCTQSRRRWVQP
jgi:hypothetical protein